MTMQMPSEENTNACFVCIPGVVYTVHVFVKRFLEDFRTNTENVPTERNSFLGGTVISCLHLLSTIFSI